MPCVDGGPDLGRWEKQQRLDEATRLLCTVCRGFSAEKISSIKGLKTWWARHKKEDAIREDRELAQKKAEDRRKAVLKKLTYEEQQILGLK
jgi:hypothetical protein